MKKIPTQHPQSSMSSCQHARKGAVHAHSDTGIAEKKTEMMRILTLTFRYDRLIFHPIIDRFRIGFGLAFEHYFLPNRTANQLILYHQHGRNCIWNMEKEI